MIRLVWRSACLLCMAGCMGNGGLPNEGAQTRTPATAAGTDYPSGGLRRLTQKQYVNSIADLLGRDVTVDITLDSDLANAGLTNVGAGVIATSPQAAVQYDSAARSLALQRFANPNARAAFVGCTPKAPDANDLCAQGFIAAFGRRAWRAPLDGNTTAMAQQLYATVAQSPNSDMWQGLQTVTAMFLASPQFIYRAEIGEAQPDGRVLLTPYELATRLSYLLTNSTPDDALLMAASSGALSTSTGLQAQATRLLALPSARDTIAGFATEWMGYSGVPSLAKDPNAFPAATPTLFAAMQQEFQRVVTDIVFDRKDDFTTLLTTRNTFANQELAAFYGLPAVNGNTLVPVTLPDNGPRAGVLTMGGFLAGHAHQTVTAPTSRGFFIRTRLLCQDIPQPPANVPPLPAPVAGAGAMTMRQRMVGHESNATCAACHLLMDPLGLSLEHFDALGGYRATDSGLTLDVTGTEGGRNYDGPVALQSVLQSEPKVQDCVVRQVYRQTYGQMETAANAPVIAAMDSAFAAGNHRLTDLLIAVVTSDAFRESSGAR